MTIKEATLQALREIDQPSEATSILNHILKNQYHDFSRTKNPRNTVSAELGNFIRNNDRRVKRIRRGRGYLYYLKGQEDKLDIQEPAKVEVPPSKEKAKAAESLAPYKERALHTLLATFLYDQDIYSKTILHERSKNSRDDNQKWVHPDMVGVQYLQLKNRSSQDLLKVVNRADTFKFYSYELKREINSDYDLKKYYFQAVSNSSWANYGFLVAFEIRDSLSEEMERLNQSFGIGIIELKANPFESRILYPARYKDLDFKTLDKLCNLNKEFEKFVAQNEKLLNAQQRYSDSTRRELIEYCDDPLANDADIEAYCEKHNIPYAVDGEEEESNA